MNEKLTPTPAQTNAGKSRDHDHAKARVDGAVQAMATLDYASGRTTQKAVQRFAAQATLAELESMIHTMNGIARSLKYARSEILASGTAPVAQPSAA